MSRPAQHALTRNDAWGFDENALIAGIRAGDVGAFEAIVRRHVGALTRFAAVYIGSQDRAKDVVQEVFCALWMRRADWRPERSIESYLYGAVRNRALNLLRSDRRAIAWEARAQDDREGHDGEPIEDDRVAHVRYAMAGLTERQRAAVVLRYDRQLSVAEVAAALGITLKGAEKLLSRAILILRRAVRGER